MNARLNPFSLLDINPLGLSRILVLGALLAYSAPLHAIDLSTVTENDPAAFRAAVEAAGGSVNGEPFVSSTGGPGGTAQKVITLPTPDSYVDLPVNPATNFWTMSADLHVETMPWGKSGGAIFGVLFGPNDLVLGVTADKWSPLKAPKLFSGSTALLQEEEFQAAGVPKEGVWQKFFIHLDSAQWKLQIGDSFEKSGTIEGDERGVLKRRSKLFMRVGNFAGSTTLPVFTEQQ